jgi:hypothetical protein
MKPKPLLWIAKYLLLLLPITNPKFSMQKIVCITLIALCYSINLIGQQNGFHLAGKINISIANGTIEGDLTISNLPKGNNFGFALNKGLNITSISDSSTQEAIVIDKSYDENVSYEANLYLIRSANDLNNPQPMNIKYNGKFDVVSDMTKAERKGDWKGNIAFNGKSIRASEQSVWYPVIYDFQNELLENKVSYDLNIQCLDCESIYINGNSPYHGQKNQFISKEKYALMLFVGKAEFTTKEKTHFINTELKNDQLNTLNQWTENIINYYEKKLAKPYGDDITFIYTTPVTKENAWMFFTYPSITIIGHEKYNLKSYFKDDTRLRDSSLVQYLSHEMGHFYFGNVLIPRGQLKWAFLEGVTEYMSLLATRELISEKAYKSKLIDYLSEINGYVAKPLNTVKNDEVDGTYRYSYVPLLLTTLEKKVGKETMWQWLKTLVNTDKNSITDYDFFKSTLLKSGVSETDFKNFEFICIKADNAQENVVKIINKGL